jgi:hypothetical protein
VILLVFFLFSIPLVSQPKLCVYNPGTDTTLKSLRPGTKSIYIKRSIRTGMFFFGRDTASIRRCNPNLSKKPKYILNEKEIYFFNPIQIPENEFARQHIGNGNVIFIDADSLHLFAYKDSVLILSTYISEGKKGIKRLTSGDYPIRKKSKILLNWSNTYNAPMPFSFHLYLGRFLHTGEVITGRDSQGCVRIAHVYAKKLYENFHKGDKIIIRRRSEDLCVKTPN